MLLLLVALSSDFRSLPAPVKVATDTYVMVNSWRPRFATPWP